MDVSRREFVTLAGMGACAGAGLLAGCTSVGGNTTASLDATNSATGNPLSFFDMHCDTIDCLGMLSYPPYSDDPDVWTGTLAQNNCEMDPSRRGAVRWVQCYAIWIPDDDKGLSHYDWYHRAAAYFKDQMQVCADTMTQVRSFGEVEAVLDAGKVAAILTVENAACLDAGLQVVDEFAEDGVLIAGVTWNGKNVLGSGNDSTDGLTDLGRDYVAALEERDIVVDVSHLNEPGFWDVEKIATKPFIATHSNARAVCDAPRNLTDDQFHAIAERGGLVGLNLHKGFVHADGCMYDFDLLARHVERWLDLGGQDVIAFGTDRDGANLPSWLAHCSSQEYLFTRFAERLGDELARKLFFDNAQAFFARYES